MHTNGPAHQRHTSVIASHCGIGVAVFFLVLSGSRSQHPPSVGSMLLRDADDDGLALLEGLRRCVSSSSSSSSSLAFAPQTHTPGRRHPAILTLFPELRLAEEGLLNVLENPRQRARLRDVTHHLDQLGAVAGGRGLTMDHVLRTMRGLMQDLRPSRPVRTLTLWILLTRLPVDLARFVVCSWF